jgi:hypothetical protein
MSNDKKITSKTFLHTMTDQKGDTVMRQTIRLFKKYTQSIIKVHPNHPNLAQTCFMKQALGEFGGSIITVGKDKDGWFEFEILNGNVIEGDELMETFKDMGFEIMQPSSN